jgi:hypothetical protein
MTPRWRWPALGLIAFTVHLLLNAPHPDPAPVPAPLPNPGTRDHVCT